MEFILWLNRSNQSSVTPTNPVDIETKPINPLLVGPIKSNPVDSQQAGHSSTSALLPKN